MEAHSHEQLLPALGHALLHGLGITLFVFLMMVVVDYLNVFSRGRLGVLLRGGALRQVIVAALLGVLPGCLGSFVVVTLYMRGLVGLGALVGCFLASSGDAAFVMLASFPATALGLMALLLAVGIGAGLLVEVIARRRGWRACAGCELAGHHDSEPECRIWPGAGLRENWRRPLPLRLLLLLVLAAAGFAVGQGWLGPEEWGWERLAILGLQLLALLVILTVPDHYLHEHVGRHIIIHHLPRVLAWTLGTLLLLALAGHYLHLEQALARHPAALVVVAGLVGLLPDSGPHLLFVFLYAQGTVPFSVLLTSSLVQDGHGLLPLLSVSVRDSLLVKLLNLLVGLLVGLTALALGA